MFIVNGKSHCCNDTFTDVRFRAYIAVSKEYLRRVVVAFVEYINEQRRYRYF